MTNELIQIKFKQRLNKLDSADADNLFCWQIQEAFNKELRAWTRRQLEGLNQKKEGRESSSQLEADLQQLLTTWETTFVDKTLYFESCAFPDDYLMFSRIAADGKKEGCCPAARLTLYPGKESNVDLDLKDVNKRPNLEWRETFYTLFGDTIRIYTDNKFDIENVKVSYYREPTPVQFLGCTDTETGLTSTVNVECEFKDSIVELIIDGAVATIAFDLADQNNAQRSLQNEQINT